MNAHLQFLRILAVVGLAATALPTTLAEHPSQRTPEDPLHRKVELLALRDEYLVDGIAKLNSLEKDIGFTIEFLPGGRDSAPPPDPRFTARIADATVRDVLNWLCQLDSRYVWRPDGNIVNFIPRDALHDPDYLFNRVLPRLAFENLLSATDGLEPIFKPVSKPGESVVSLTNSGSFAKPWSATFQNISVRDALNRLATQLGPGHGWMVYGNQQTKILSFYASLMT